MKIIKNKKTNEVLLTLNDVISDEYEELVPNTVDAAVEKHIPVYEIIEDKIKVTVGSVNHPMIDTHYIMWIALVNESNIIIKKLNPNEEPTAIFQYIKGSSIYAYCNLHGLWKTDIK